MRCITRTFKNEEYLQHLDYTLQHLDYTRKSLKGYHQNYGIICGILEDSNLPSTEKDIILREDHEPQS